MSKQKAKQHHNCSRGFRPVVGVMNLPFQGCARIARAAAALVFHLHIYYISLYYYFYYILSIIARTAAALVFHLHSMTCRVRQKL